MGGGNFDIIPVREPPALSSDPRKLRRHKKGDFFLRALKPAPWTISHSLFILLVEVMEGVVQGCDTTNILHGLFDSKAMSFRLLFHKCIRKLLYDTLYRNEILLIDVCFTARKREKLY